MTNADLKKLARQKGVYLWQIAHELGITDATFSRKLRRELPETEKLKIHTIIERLEIKEA